MEAEARGSAAPAVAEGEKLPLKGGEQPGVHFELVDMFLECGHFSLSVSPPPTAPVPGLPRASGGGERGRSFGPGHQTPWKWIWAGGWFTAQMLKKSFFLRAPPSPPTSPASLLFSEPDASQLPGNKRKAPPGPLGSAQLWVFGPRVSTGAREELLAVGVGRAGGPATDPSRPPR